MFYIVLSCFNLFLAINSGIGLMREPSNLGLSAVIVSAFASGWCMAFFIASKLYEGGGDENG